MSAIVYISGPIEAESEHGCSGVDGDTLRPSVARTESKTGLPGPCDTDSYFRSSRFNSGLQPPLTQRIRHDYAYLADRPVDTFNSDRPVTRCDRCMKVAMTTIVVSVTVLLYVIGYLQKVGAP